MRNGLFALLFLLTLAWVVFEILGADASFLIEWVVKP